MSAKRPRTLRREQAFPVSVLEHLQGRWRTDCLGRLTVSKHTARFDDSTIGMCILRFREDGFVLLGKWSARPVLSSSELSWSCSGCATITWTKELTFAALDPELLRHVLLFAGRTSATNLAMACSCAFRAGLMPRPTIVAEVFDADATAAYFHGAWVPSARIEDAGLSALTSSDRYSDHGPRMGFGPLRVRSFAAVGRYLISEGLRSWAFRVRGISHVRFGVLRIPEEHERRHGCIGGPESTPWLLPYVEYPNDRCEKDLSLVLDMHERDLRLFGLFGDRRKPRFFHSIANLPCGSYKLVVEFVPHAFVALGQVSCGGSVKLLGEDPPPGCT
jgi:hypothetical protein